MMFLLSVIMGITPLLGIGWIAENGSFITVDGLFTTLILLTLSAILFLNAFLDLRKRPQSKSQAPQAQKAS
jgi:hypothetical protein